MIRIIEILQLLILPFTIISFVALFILIGFIKINYSNEDFFKRLFYFKIGKPAFIIVIIGFVLIFTLDSLKNKLIRNEIIEFASKQDINAKINGEIDLCFKPVEFKKNTK